MRRNHLSEERLAEMCLTEAPSSSEQQHLGACSACETRRVSLAHVLGEIAQAASEDAAAALSAERLAKQQLRIMKRLEHEGRPGRVISFPAHQPLEAAALRTRPASRWIAAAAVAGLIIGVAAGRIGYNPSRVLLSSQALSSPAPTRPAGVAAMRTVSTTISDDELLGRIELAIDGRGGASLQALDDLTPRTWDVR